MINEPLGPYRALRRLLIPNGPGVIPSSTRIAVGEVFSFDGDEPVDVRLLLRCHVIEPYTGDLSKLQPVGGN